MSRANEIVRHVLTDHGNIWDAYDQGRLAHATGWPREQNPHIPGHVNASDWLRGWDDEETTECALASAAFGEER